LRLDEGLLMVCLHLYTKKQIRHGRYFEDNTVLCDTIEDWQNF